jgi:RNA polymerase sigma-70 factor (ECF subfamily)
MEMPRANEPEMIARILAGERELFHELIRPYERMVYLTVSAMLKNEADAEDAVQDAVIKAYRNLAAFRAESRFSTWLTAIALNEARGRLRRIKRENIESLDAELEMHDGDFTPAALMDWHPIPSEALASKDLADKIKAAVAELPFLYREVLTLRDLDELQTEETAVLLNVSIQVVKTRLHRARMLLQKRLAPALKGFASQPAPRRSWLSRRHP